MPVTENATSHSQRLLTNLQGLQRRVSERLAEREAELRELSGADTRLDELQQELDVLRPDQRRWSAERQALMDRRDELSRAIAIAEAHGKQTVETATENARRLQEELEQARALVLRTQQELADQEGAHLADQAGTAQRRDRLAIDLSHAQAQVTALAADKQRQDDDLAALLARVGTLEQQLQGVAGAEAEQQHTPTDPRDVAEKQQQLDLVSDEIRRQRDAVAALRTEQQQLSEERSALLARVAELELALQAGASSQIGDQETSRAEQTQLFGQLAQLEQALKVREQDSFAIRDQLTADLDQARHQLTEFSKREEQWGRLEEDRARLQAHLQVLEQSWVAREAAIAEERAQWQRHLQSLTGQDAAQTGATLSKRRFFRLPRVFRRPSKGNP